MQKTMRPISKNDLKTVAMVSNYLYCWISAFILKNFSVKILHFFINLFQVKCTTQYIFFYFAGNFIKVSMIIFVELWDTIFWGSIIFSIFFVICTHCTCSLFSSWIVVILSDEMLIKYIYGGAKMQNLRHTLYKHLFDKTFIIFLNVQFMQTVCK